MIMSCSRHWILDLSYRSLLPYACMLISIVLALTGCGGGGGSDESSINPEPERKWTYMVYMAADNNLSIYADLDINEMEIVGSGDDVNIVVQVEFSPIYNEDLAGHTLRGKITRDTDWDVINSDLADIGSQNMVDPQTLAAFIAWAAHYYPAQRYALVVWSHSDGWKGPASSLLPKGVISDSSNDPGKLMSIQDVAGAVRSSGVDLDLINFDACLMGMYEVAYEFGGLADYLVFSEELYPSFGDAYDDILEELAADPDMNGFDLARVITSQCIGFYQYISEMFEYDLAVTKSAIDMSYIDELHNGLCSLAGIMIDTMDTEGSNIQTARDDSLSYDYPENHDLGDFLVMMDENTANTELKAAIQQVQDTMSDLVISNEVYSSVPGDEILRSQGIAMYLPAGSQVYDDDLSVYSELACNLTLYPTWGDLVAELVEYELSP